MILTVALAFASACFSLALALNLLRLVTATTWAPRQQASWTAAEPTPPEAPVMSTRSPALQDARCNMFSAVP